MRKAKIRRQRKNKCLSRYVLVGMQIVDLKVWMWIMGLSKKFNRMDLLMDGIEIFQLILGQEDRWMLSCWII